MEKKIQLSIIVPCFNANATLEEAVDSVHEQGLTEPFEVILIDDFSTDNTKEVIQKLAGKYPDIKFDFNEENLGGGATRNRCVEISRGELIFCLDSDDILPQGTLKKMVDFQEKEKCQGVGVNISKKFIHPDIQNISYINKFKYIDEKIPFQSLILSQFDNPLYSTFLVTREAFQKCGGYPEKHGFDTQGFAFRFLANGWEARTCPDTVYLHRILQHKSYFLSELEKGNVNRNWYLIFEEFLYLFNNKTREKILDFCKEDNEASLFDLIKNESRIFHPKLNKLISMGKKKALRYLPGDKFIYFCQGNESLNEKNYDKALNYYNRAIKAGFIYPVIFLKFLLLSRLMGNLRNQDKDLSKRIRFYLDDSGSNSPGNKKNTGSLFHRISNSVKISIKRRRVLNNLIKPIYNRIKK